MKTLYLECSMGAAGDMLMAALYDLMDEDMKKEFLEKMASIGLEGVSISVERAVSHGISGSHMHVIVNGEEEAELLAHGHEHHHEHEHEHHHHHHDEEDAEHEHHHHHDDEDGEHEHEHHHHAHHDDGAHDHEHGHEHSHGHHHHHHATPGSVALLIDNSTAPEDVKARARSVYDAIARAEAKVHGASVTDVHYHEVGAMDAVADVTGVCLALSMLAPDKVIVSPIHVGSGEVECAHGIVPVPAPATVELLKGVPYYTGDVFGELCTPTGAALLSNFADEYGPMPVMTVDSVGYGVGTKDFGRANVIRAFMGEVTGSGNGKLTEIVANIDDMSPEDLNHACNRLLERGALDVYLLAGTMKKGRAGHQITVLCDPSVADAMAIAVLEETTTNGVRVHDYDKYSLVPTIVEAQTEWGAVRAKVAEGFGVRHVKPEHDDVSRVAAENGLPIKRVYEAVLRALGE